MPELPDCFDRHQAEILNIGNGIEGHVRDREMKFLVLLSACPTAEGRILEIGSFKGKSTVVLSKGAGLAGDPRVSAVDPMTSPAETDPDLLGQASSWGDFRRNLQRHQVLEHVECFRMTSNELARTWNHSIRLLWIDGDHTYPGVNADFDNFMPHLVDRGIIAMDDVIRPFEGCVRVFCEKILLSDHFGPCGVVGKIGWAQYFADPAEGRPYRDRKLELYRRMSRLIPYAVLGRELSGYKKLCFRLHRARIPHLEIEPQDWIGMIH